MFISFLFFQSTPNLLFYLLLSYYKLWDIIEKRSQKFHKIPLFNLCTDVTTVLLVDNNNRSSHGRFLNVKPAVGLLTSTARTFIQEGVTTEYATRVLGTTLDNGRLYAQLLTKSSRVLYDHENSPNPTKSYYSQQNDIVSDSDEGSDWPHNKNEYDSPVTFIKNTDYISPNQPINAFLVYPTARQSQASEDRDVFDYRHDEKKDIVMADHIKAEALVDQRPETVVDSVQNVKESFSVSKSSSQGNQEKDIKMKIKVDKVQPANNLPTYTIKNEFAPSGFSWEDPDYDVQTEKQFLTTPDKRNGKMLYQAGIPKDKEDMKNFPTVTYYGFADFTTIVGDTVIVFSPQTVSPVNVGQITSIKGDATLHNDPAVVVSTVKTFLSHELGMVTETIKGHSINMETTLPTMIIEPVTPYRQSKGDDEMDNEAQTTPLSSTDKNEVTTMSEEMMEEMMEKEIDEATQRVHTISPNLIQPSEITSSSITLSKPSNEDIASLLASLASVKASQEHQATEPLETQFIASETKVSGGVTTIFFEDDPFDQFFQTSQSNEQSIQPTPSSARDVPIKTVESSTENIVEITTMDADFITTEDTIAEATTLKQSDSDSESDEADTTTVVPIINDNINDAKEIFDSKSDVPTCIEDSILTSSTHLKTLTYMTTFFIPSEDTTTTSIQAREVISTEVNYACIVPSTVAIEPIITTAVIDTPEVKKEPTTVPINNAEKDEETTESVMQISTEASVSEATSKANVEKTEDDENDEIELIYKTLYTTYTYLTTFFHESTSSISSRKEVVTNIVTSTLDMGQLNSDDALSNLVAQMGGKDAIQPTSVGIGRPTTSFQPIENNLHGIDDIFLEESREVHATPALDTQNLNLGDIKTYYTTYTYFTTIFVDGETEISSRTEVYTNYVGNSITPTAMSAIVKDSSSVIYDDSENVENNILEHTSPVKSYDNTIRRTPSGQKITSEDSTETSTESEDDENNAIQPSYSTMVRGSDASSVDDNTEGPITMVTDVKSSSSDGDRQIIENVNRQWNGLLEDQISSESNTEEIVPSPTLLLQTSYTTFTYFTTMYIGKSSSNILSRLETVTNVVTETLQPSRAVQVEEASLPITYFTTFTYWTTLYKDGSVTTTSREETVSNIVSPSVSIEPTTVVEPIQATTVPTVNVLTLVTDEDAPPAQVISTTPSTAVNVSEPTTYYTTYTYFTTLYVGDDTVLNSRFETVTNVVEPTVAPTGRAINLDNTNNIIPANEKIEKTKLFAPAFVPTAVNEPIAPTQPAVVNSEPTGIISLNQGKIIDAEGISTIFYTTKAIGSNINGLYAQVIESTSSVIVDESKKAAQTTSTPDVPGSRVHKTGLVRLIEGTIVSNRTTTLYESKVIGTIIDGRYAQVIESTSSFLIEKTIEPTGVLPNSIQPTATLKLPIKSKNIISPTSSVVQGSISENGGEEETTEEGYEDDEEGEEDDEEDDGTGKKKSRLTFQSRKRTFTPVIRPFASRNRPTFAPKRKNLSPSSATIITRSDFTPTITATPAIKSESSRGRFTSNKRQSSSISVPNSSVASLSSSRRFSRPSRTSAAPGNGLSSSTLARSRSSASSRIQPTSTSLPSGSSTRRPNIFRASSPIARPSILPSNSRFRINPTQSSSFNRGGQSSSVNTTPRPIDIEESDEDNLTTNVTNFPTDTTGDDETQTTTENTRRNQNPLLRFRRPLSSGRAQSINTSVTTSRPATITTRRSPLLGRGRATSTTSTTTTTPKPKPRSFQRPAFTPQAPSTLPGTRTRPGSSLFPPRTLFRPASINQDLEKDDESTDNQLSDESKDTTDLSNDSDIVKASADDNVEDSNTRDTRENKKYTVGFRKRVKRQVDYGSRTNSYSSRYRRPTPISRSLVDDTEEQEIQTTRPKVTTIGRFTPNDRTSRLQNGNSNGNSVNKNAQSNNRIRPTSSSSQSGRAQFTLREKDNLSSNSRSNFRRGNNNAYSSTNRRKTSTTASSRPKSPRLRNYSGIVTESPYNSRNTNSRSRSSRGRTTSRSRSRNGQDNLDYAIQPSFDGTITVTHHIPTEHTIPVINGKVTEYKNILTAKVSTEVLGPKQYSTSIGSNGKNVIVLNNEITGIGSHGATEITQFFLQETPTTSITFTPTTIRGRKTSFSHVIPSTVYNVEEVISTIQPQIAANAPLANILLSQLLLGNLGIPQQQQQINPLLGVQQQQMIQQGPAVPQTEFKVRTTTYVTTVTHAMSTVIPLTFRGKEILTTIVDNSVDVITATEFLTDTIVSTPTVVQQPQQINSLFLNQLLLQQQQQQQPQQLLQPLTNDAIAQNLFQDAIKVDNDDSTQSNKLYSSDVDDIRDNGREYDDYPEHDQLDNVPTVNKVMIQRKSNRKYNNNRQITQSPLETSIITLYVSGRRPGEFSTVLSTVITTPDSYDSSLQKRAVAEYEEVKPSVSINDIDLYEPEGSDIEQYILPATDLRIESSIDDNRSETESLESIIGDVSKYINMNGDISKMGIATTTVHAQKQQPLKNTAFLA